MHSAAADWLFLFFNPILGFDFFQYKFDEKLFHDVFVAIWILKNIKTHSKNIVILQKYHIWEFCNNISVQVGKVTGRELVSLISGGSK